jgi:hypothetical protein
MARRTSSGSSARARSAPTPRRRSLPGRAAGRRRLPPEVRVVPTVSLTPAYSTVPWSYDEYVTITAPVQPENAAAVVWSGAGWTPTESNLLRHVPRWDVPGSYSVFANVGEDTEQQEAVVQIQEPRRGGSLSTRTESSSLRSRKCRTRTRSSTTKCDARPDTRSDTGCTSSIVCPLVRRILRIRVFQTRQSSAVVPA